MLIPRLFPRMFIRSYEEERGDYIVFERVFSPRGTWGTSWVSDVCTAGVEDIGSFYLHLQAVVRVGSPSTEALSLVIDSHRVFL